MDNRELHLLAGGIAAALGDGWGVVSPVTGFEQSAPHIRKGPKGPEFYLSGTWAGKGRIHVGANWPKDANGKEQRPYFSQYSENGAAAPPSITFSETKTPVQAARDIKVRFLPFFLPLWDKQAAQVAASADYATKREHFAHVVASLLGGEVKQDRSELSVVYLGYRAEGYRAEGIHEVSLDHETETVGVSLRSITLAQLEAIQKLLKEN